MKIMSMKEWLEYGKSNKWTTAKVKGGLADNESISSIAKMHDVSIVHIVNQIAMGLKVEKEHTDDESVALEISMDHLVEDPDYYTKLSKMESED